MKVQTSEYCAVGHPDRTCDFIVAYILDRLGLREPGYAGACEEGLFGYEKIAAP